MNTIFVNVCGEDKEWISERIRETDRTDSQFFCTFNEAQQYMEINLVDMTFLDITGKNLNWMEQYNKIKLIDNAALIVIISDNILEAVKAYEVGAFDFLLKPVKREQLERIFQKAGRYLMNLTGI